MENSLIDNDVLYKRVAVQKTRFPLYRTYIDNGIPLPPLPYSLMLTHSPKVTYHSVYTHISAWFGEQTYTTIQASAWWNSDHNNFNQVVKEWNEMVVNVDADLDNKVLTKLKGQSVSIGLMYAQRKQTNDLLISTLEKLLRAMSMIRHPKRMVGYLYGRTLTRREARKVARVAKHASRKAQSVAEAWLMYRYAWTPLILDCRDALRALAVQKKKLYRHHVRAQAKLMFEGEPKPSTFSSIDDVTTVVSGFMGSHIKLFYDVTNPLATAWSSLADPVQQLWDFVPFSFVVDWFCDVSTALDLRSATWGTTFTAGYRTKMSSRTIKSIPADQQSSYEWYGSINHQSLKTLVAPADRLDITVERVVLNQFPELHLTFPLEDGLNVARVFDLAALLASAGAKRLRSYTSF